MTNNRLADSCNSHLDNRPIKDSADIPRHVVAATYRSPASTQFFSSDPFSIDTGNVLNKSLTASSSD
jgi:hypothetical protein